MNLLELIALKCHVEYISDLKICANWKQAVLEIPVNNFTLKEWQEVVRYLCSTVRSFQSPEQAKKYLIEWEKR